MKKLLQHLNNQFKSKYFSVDWVRDRIFDCTDIGRLVFIRIVYGKKFKRVGVGLKMRGASRIQIGSNVALGRFCWLESVYSYNRARYDSKIVIEEGVAMSDLVHISCAMKIMIGSGSLIGSKVYVGDHGHGFGCISKNREIFSPLMTDLSNIAPIIIGRCCWIGDGSVVLAGTEIADCSVIGANSVVSIKVDRAALIAGVPARVIRYLD